jgi:hypothetical protein
MSAERLSRRGLFEALLGLERSPPAPRVAAFSLRDFYAKRSVAGQEVLPPFELRSGLPDARRHTTLVGVPDFQGVVSERNEKEPT